MSEKNFNKLNSEYDEDTDEWVETTLCSSSSNNILKNNNSNSNNPYSFKPKLQKFDHNKYSERANFAENEAKWKGFYENSNSENINNFSTKFEDQVDDLSREIRCLILKKFSNNNNITPLNKKLQSENKVLGHQLAKAREENSSLKEKLKNQEEVIKNYQIGLVVDGMDELRLNKTERFRESSADKDKIIEQLNLKIEHMKKIQLGQAKSINRLKEELSESSRKSDVDSFEWGFASKKNDDNNNRSKNSSPINCSTVGGISAYFKQNLEEELPKLDASSLSLDHFTEQNYQNIIYLICKHLIPGDLDLNQSIIFEAILKDSRLNQKLIIVLTKSLMATAGSIKSAITSKHASKITQILIKLIFNADVDYFKKIYNIVKYKFGEYTFHPKAAYFLGSLIETARYKDISILASKIHNPFFSNPHNFYKACKHFAGTHVVQAFISRLDENDLEWFVIASRAKLVDLACDKYGNYVVGQLLDKLSDKSLLIDNLVVDFDSLQILREDSIGKHFMKKVDLL